MLGTEWTGRDIEALLPSLRGAAFGADGQDTDAESEQWQEQGPWLLLVLLPLAALAFRRGWFSPLPMLLLFVLPPPEANAGIWEDLWWRNDQQAMHRLQSGDAEQAKTLFERPDWRAAAAYQSGDYAAALETLELVVRDARERRRVLRVVAADGVAVDADDVPCRGPVGLGEGVALPVVEDAADRGAADAAPEVPGAVLCAVDAVVDALVGRGAGGGIGEPWKLTTPLRLAPV